jgi:hypothetical protein
MSVQERLEANPIGRAAITGLIIVTLGAMLISNLPPSTLRETALPIVRPLLDTTGLNQNWNLFAPNPRKSTLRLEARITYQDGTTSVWRTPISDQIVGEYRAFRWRKWASYVVSNTRCTVGPRLCPVTALWLARIHAVGGKVPVRVELYRQSYTAPKLGSGDFRQPPWVETHLYTLTIVPQS